MGKPSMNQCEGSIKHFSHQHPLQLHNQVVTHAYSCSGCHEEASGYMYTCTICNYYLHKKCSEMPQKITHPFDQEHVLCLLEKPKYPEGIFNCDGCGKKGGGFCYHCETCGIDLHILCASLPIHFNHHCHVHELTLSFSPAYPKKSFHCGICQYPGTNVWFYRCSICEFDVHLSCVSAMRKPQLLQASSSMPNINIQNPISQPFGRQLSMGAPQMMTPQNNLMMNHTTNQAFNGCIQPMLQQQNQMVQQQQQALVHQNAILQQHVLAQKQASMQLQQQMMMQQRPMMAPQQGGNMLLNSFVDGLSNGISSAATDAILQGIMGGGMMADPSD